MTRRDPRPGDEGDAEPEFGVPNVVPSASSESSPHPTAALGAEAGVAFLGGLGIQRSALA